MNINKIALLLIIGILCLGAFAQEICKVDGMITDENGDPLPGANISLTGTGKGVFINGFSLAEYHNPLNDISQFPDIPVPGVSIEHLFYFR